jgi:hypothetical protein
MASRRAPTETASRPSASSTWTATPTTWSRLTGDGVIVNGPNSTGNTIGGAPPAARNLIVSASNANTVRGNLIGTKGTTDLGNTQHGVRMTSSSNNVVTDNVVAFNGDANHNDNGVEVFKSGAATPVGNRILNNSISSNQAPGIDLSLSTGSVGREQDLKDPDTGTNNLQNFPVITSARLATRRIGGHRRKVTLIKGTLNSEADKTVRDRPSWARRAPLPTQTATPGRRSPMDRS